MELHNKLIQLFEQRINGDCSDPNTRLLLCPVIAYIDSREQDKAATMRKKMFDEICTEFQWFYWAAEDYYGGVGDWREFPPICASQMNKALRGGKTSVQITMAQRQYVVDFNEMTKRAVQDNASLHYGVPIFVKAFKKEDFDINKFFALLDRLNRHNDKHVSFISHLFKLLRSSQVEPLDNELAINTLTLLYRLITHEGMAEKFLQDDENIATLLNLRCKDSVNDPNAPVNANNRIQTLISLLLCHYINSDQGQMEDAYDGMIRSATQGKPISLLEANSRRHTLRARRYHNDPKRVFRLLAPLAAVAPKTFVESIIRCLALKKNELQIKERCKTTIDEEMNSHSYLTKILNAIVSQLLSGTKSRSIQADFVFQHANLLKLLSEVLRNYPAAPPIFIHNIAAPNGQTVLKSIIDEFILKKINNPPPNNTNAEEEEERNKAEIAVAAKAVLSSLISGSTISTVTDQIVDDFKTILSAITDEHMRHTCACTNPGQKTKLGTKYAEQLSIVANLVVLLRETTIQQQQTETGITLFKSIHKYNLLNDFVRAIWSLPLHEKQGVDAVNTLLKMFEGIASKENNGLLTMYNRRNVGGEQTQQTTTMTDLQPTTADSEQYTYTTNTADTFASVSNSIFLNSGTFANESSSAGPADRQPNPMDDEDPTMLITTESQGAAATDNTIVPTESQRLAMEAASDATLDTPAAGQGDETMDDARSSHSEQSDEEMHEEEEDDDQAQEEDMNEEENFENPYENMTLEEDGEEAHHHHHHHQVEFEQMAGGIDVDDDEDDDDDEEEEEEEEDVYDNVNEDGALQIVNFEDPMLEMADFANITNEMNAIRQDINRINMNINQAQFAAQHIQQALMQMPRNIRQFIGHHPRGGAAVLRIRDGHGRDPRLHRPVQFGFNIRGDRNNMIAQLMHHFANGQFPGIEAQPQHQVPYLLDRLSDQCRILDATAVLHIATILISYLMPAIELPPDEPPKEKSEKKSAKDETTDPVATATENGNEEEGGIDEAERSTVQTPPVSSPTPPQINEEANGNAPNVPDETADASNEPPQQQQPIPVPEGVDQEFLAALPEDMRQEVLRDHLLQQQMNAAPAAQPNDQDLPPERLAAILGMEVPEGLDPAFLAALPEDIFQEVVRDHQRQQANNRQRQIRRQAAIRHHHHRHFAMPMFYGGRFMRPGGDDNQRQEMTTTMSNERAIQVFDNESIATFLLLYLFDQDTHKFNFVRLQKLLRSICIHPVSCDFTIWALISLLDGLERFGNTYADNGSGKYRAGWVNNFRMGTSVDRNERILHITPTSIHINQQVRSTAANNVLDTLCYLAQRFANHFLPKNPATTKNEQQPPPQNIAIFWNIVRCINNKNTEDALKESSMDSRPLAEGPLEDSPFAFILKLACSNMAKANHQFMEKLIRAALGLSQGIRKQLYEKASDGTKHWVGDQLKELQDIVLDNGSDEARRDWRPLLVQLLKAFPNEKQKIRDSLHIGILDSGKQLMDQLTQLLGEMRNEEQ